ncbi:MAG: methyl-accepting chemotaxis protein [Arcobacteraceae bacterium]
MKQKTISARFVQISILISVTIMLVGYFILNAYKSTIDDEVYKNTQLELTSTYKEYFGFKKDIGITNAFSIANDGQIKQALSSDNRALAINSLDNINATLKNGTSFKNVQIHIHTTDNKSYLRNWKVDKYGDDLSSFRASVVKVNSSLQPINGYEVGKAGLSLRSVVPIIDEGKHLGSLEFIQGLNSVAKTFDQSNEGFILLMDIENKIVEPSPDKVFQNKYIISQNFMNETFFNDLKSIKIDQIIKDKIVMTKKYFYTSVEVTDFTGKKLGVAIIARSIDTVNIALDKTEFLIYLAMIILVMATLLTLIGTIITVKKIVLKPIKQLQNSIDDIITDKNAKTIEVLNNDEIGEVVTSFNNYLNSIEAGIQQDQIAIDEAKMVISRANAGLLNTNIKSVANSTRVQSLTDEINKLVNGMRLNLDSISQVLVAFSNAKFDYDVKIIEGVTGEIASIMNGAKNTGVTISSIIAIVDMTTKTLLASAKELNESSGALSNSSNTQAAGLEEASAAIEEILASIKQSSNSAIQMADLAKDVTTSTNNGSVLANRTSTAMSEITEQVTAINDAITIIDQIAFQTNILSLNAAVEAATAGEAGKGFAVVAQEVRNLASRSAEAANEIKALVEKAALKTKEGQVISEEMIAGYNTLDKDITSTITLINDVASSSKEQQIAMVQISDTVNQLDRVTQENASVAGNINVMANNNEQLAQNLEVAITRTAFLKNAENGVCDMDLLFDFGSLKADHINFKNTNFLNCEHDNHFTVTDHHSCRLGKWIDGVSDTDFTESEHWDTLKDSHKHVHEMTQEVTELYATGAENEKIFGVTNEVEKNIDVVFTTLDRLREDKCSKMKEENA